MWILKLREYCRAIKRDKWPKLELDWLRTNAEGKPRKELFGAYTKKFGIKQKYSAFLGALRNHHIRTGVDCCFKPVRK